MPCLASQCCAKLWATSRHVIPLSSCHVIPLCPCCPLPCPMVQSLLNEVRMAAGRVILFIDELHMLMDAGRVEGGMNAGRSLCGTAWHGMAWRGMAHHGSMRMALCARAQGWLQVELLPSTICGRTSSSPSAHLVGLPSRSGAANLLKPALARGDLHCIGATTGVHLRCKVADANWLLGCLQQIQTCKLPFRLQLKSTESTSRLTAPLLGASRYAAAGGLCKCRSCHVDLHDKL